MAPLARASELSEQPQAFRLLNEYYVAYRSSSGEPRVFLDRCPHRGAPLSLGHVDEVSLHCAYHGWQFDGDGVCVAIPALGDDATIPARASLRSPARVYESHGMVYVAVEDPLTDPPTIAVASDESFLRGDLPVRVTRASAGLLADNFLDMAHFPFVHTGTFGAGEEKVVANYHVEREGFGFRASYEHLFSHREDPGVASGLRPLVQRRRLTYRYQAPFHLELAIDFLDAGGSNVIGFFLAPEDNDTVRIYSSLWRNDLEGSKQRMDEAVAFEVAVVEEDLRIQSRYHHLSLPLDPTAEMHTRADKTTVELRRVLRDFVKAARGV